MAVYLALRLMHNDGGDLNVSTGASVPEGGGHCDSPNTGLAARTVFGVVLAGTGVVVDAAGGVHFCVMYADTFVCVGVNSVRRAASFLPPSDVGKSFVLS